MNEIESEKVREAVTMALDLVRIIEKRAITTSLKVAEVFKRNHKDVLRAIKDLQVPEEWGRRNFAPSSYKNEQRKDQPMYEITRDGFTLLAMGFTGPEAMQFKLRYIEAFNMMEEALHTGVGLATPEEFRVWSAYIEHYCLAAEDKLLRINAKLDRLNEDRPVGDSPLNAFVEKTLRVTRDGIVLKASVFEAYVAFCKELMIIPLSRTEFFNRLYDEHAWVKPVSRTINGKSHSCLRGLVFAPEFLVKGSTLS